MNFGIPAINVVFLLLLFFIATGRLSNPQEFQVAPPLSRALPLEHLPRPLLSMTASGELLLDGEFYSETELLAVLEQRGREGASGTGTLSILPDQSLPAWRLLDLMRKIRERAPFELRVVTAALRPAEPGS